MARLIAKQPTKFGQELYETSFDHFRPAVLSRLTLQLWRRKNLTSSATYRSAYRDTVDLKVPGDWELATRSAVGRPALVIGGSIIQTGNILSSAVHVDGSSCFEQKTVILLTGTLTDGNISMGSASVNGQVITVAGAFTKKDGFPHQLTGTYTIDGGCACGDEGSLTGYSVDGINGVWYGNLTTEEGANIHWGTDRLGQVEASSEGSFGLTGAFNFDGTCFKSGALTPGTFPTPSFILGTPLLLSERQIRTV